MDKQEGLNNFLATHLNTPLSFTTLYKAYLLYIRYHTTCQHIMSMSEFDRVLSAQGILLNHFNNKAINDTIEELDDNARG